MIYVCSNHRPVELLDALDAVRLKRFDGIDFWKKGKRFPLGKGDFLICWGKRIPQLEGVSILNAGVAINKHQQFETLRNLGMYAPHCLPVLGRNNSYQYIARSERCNADDLITPPDNPAFWMYKQLDIEKEYRIHSFGGRCITKPGVKIQTNKDAHSWIRTEKTGWTVAYNTGEAFDSRYKKVAHEAVKRLGLTFGAVDLGIERATSRAIVLGVNDAPAIWGEIKNAYLRAINRWIKEQKEGNKVVADVEEAPVPNAGPDINAYVLQYIKQLPVQVGNIQEPQRAVEERQRLDAASWQRFVAQNNLAPIPGDEE